MEYYNKALDIYEKVLGTEHPSTATTYWNIATVYYGQGENQDALVLLKKAFIIYNNKFGFNHPDTQAIVNWIEDVAKAARRDGNQLIKKWRTEKLSGK